MALKVARYLSLLFLFSPFLPPAQAQRNSAIPLVPAANWTLANSQILKVDAVTGWGGDPAIEGEYGVKSLEERTYKLREKAVEVLIEDAPDPSSAYGLFTYYRNSSMTPERGMALTLSGPEITLMARGKYFVRVKRPSQAGDYRGLLIAIAGMRPSRRAMEALPPPLPPKGLVAGSEKYLLGPEATRHVLPNLPPNLIGFSEGGEAQVADYADGDTYATVLAVHYPNPQIARNYSTTIEHALQLNQDRGPASVYGTRKSSLVVLVFNAGSQAAANRFMDEFTASERLTWDQNPKPVAKQVFELIISNILIVVGVSSLAVIGGVFVFVLKRLARKLFPQSDWVESESENLIILKLR